MSEPGSSHYQGEQGRRYFSYQNQGGLQRGRINARKFAPYVGVNDVVLDFGCGNGALLYHLNCRQRIGVEINPAARQEAHLLGIEVLATLDAIGPASVDLVISNHALEHVLCPLDVLRELHERLRTGGQIVLCLPVDDWRMQRVVNPKDINHHLYTWTPLLIGNLLSEAGFAVDNAWIFTHAWPPTHWQWLDARLSVWLFDLVCRYVAWRDKRRQVMALAHKT